VNALTRKWIGWSTAKIQAEDRSGELFKTSEGRRDSIIKLQSIQDHDCIACCYFTTL